MSLIQTDIIETLAGPKMSWIATCFALTVWLISPRDVFKTDNAEPFAGPKMSLLEISLAVAV